MRSSTPRPRRGNIDERRRDEPPANSSRRPDQQILEDACRCLELDGDVDATEIEVTCETGIITLTGNVDSRQAKRRAEECVESLHGVKDVMNLLRVATLQGARPRVEAPPSVWGDRGADAIEHSNESRRRGDRGAGEPRKPE